MASQKMCRWLLACAAAAGWACGVDGGEGGPHQGSKDGSAMPDGGGQESAGADGGADAGEQGGADGGTVSFALHVAPLFNATCTGACHPGGYAPMSLEADEAVGTLVGVDSVGCTDGRVRVLPNDADPTRSYLMAKLTGAHLCSGGVMPPSGPLSADQVATVRAWIEGGAQP